MSNWDKYGIEDKIVEILKNVKYKHHFGRPFISAYQLAIEFDKRHHDQVVKHLRLPIGGVGIGRRTSLAQYLARQLSRGIKRRSITRIEGAFLGNLHLYDVRFAVPDGAEPMRSSLTGTDWPLSMYRMREPIGQ